MVCVGCERVRQACLNEGAAWGWRWEGGEMGGVGEEDRRGREVRFEKTKLL